MELFVVNRHEDDEGVSKENLENEEQSKLDKVLKKIERNKKIRARQKEKEQKRKLGKQRTIESRQIKRELKAKIIPVPENINEDFIDNPVEEESKAENKTITKRELPYSLEGFTVLGTENIVNKNKVKRVLPNWLSNPTVISVNLQNLQVKVSALKQLDKGIRKLLKANNIKYFFPVQATVIPYLLQTITHSSVIFPRDVCVSAPTGSGKTLAYVLPIIQALKRHTIKKIRALVILPTQDLALQVYKTFRLYSQNTNIDICILTGNNSFAIEQNQLIIENIAFGAISKVDILVCTAGRLVDHLKSTKGFNLDSLEFLVIDEADRVLENIQNDWLYHLEKHITKEDSPQGTVLNLLQLQKHRPAQKLLFSATLSQDPEKLQKLSLFQPKLFTSVIENESCDYTSTNTFIGKYTTPKELTEKYIVTSLELKPLHLYKFIKMENITRSIVFTHSAESAHRLAILLRALFNNERKVEEISSQLNGKNRSQFIEKFSKGEIDVLVSTDTLARGIDLPNVQCVISYSAPKYLKTYIHRAGRTARAGEEGLAVTMLNKSQLNKFNAMLQQADKTNLQEVVIPEDDLEPLSEQYKESLQQLKKTVETEEKFDLEKTMMAKGSRNLKRKRYNSVGNVANC